MKASFIVKGALTFVLPRRLYARRSGGTISARYCYSVFMRQFVRLNETTGFRLPPTVAELGPGDSIGIGLCALLAGAEEYIGLDVVPFSNLTRNRAVLDELVTLFTERAAIPDDAEFPRVRPKLSSYAFPHHLLTDKVLDAALARDRLDRLACDLAEGRGEMIRYVAPWSGPDQIEPARIDWVFSQAVMEHVDDLEAAYRAFDAWLTPDGIMSHQIDFKCHNSASEWNGHWAASDWLWSLVYGKRPYFLNRQPVTRHRALLHRTGFDILHEDCVFRNDGVPRDRLPTPYRNLSEEDLCTAGAFVISRKPVTALPDGRGCSSDPRSTERGSRHGDPKHENGPGQP